MTVIFNDNDLIDSFKQKRLLFRIYMGVLAAFIAICLVCVLYYISLPFEDPLQIVPKLIVCVATCVFVIFSYIFLGIKYHRARKYYKIISYLSVGMKQENNSIFLRYEEPELKDGVDYYVLTFCEWSQKKSEYMDRKIYCDKEKPLPQFKAGDMVRYLTQGNIIIEYEILGNDEQFLQEKQKQDAKAKPIKIGDLY